MEISVPTFREKPIKYVTAALNGTAVCLTKYRKPVAYLVAWPQVALLQSALSHGRGKSFKVYPSPTEAISSSELRVGLFNFIQKLDQYPVIRVYKSSQRYQLALVSLGLFTILKNHCPPRPFQVPSEIKATATQFCLSSGDLTRPCSQGSVIKICHRSIDGVVIGYMVKADGLSRYPKLVRKPILRSNQCRRRVTAIFKELENDPIRGDIQPVLLPWGDVIAWVPPRVWLRLQRS